MMQTHVRRVAVVVASGLAMAAGQVASAVSFHPLTSPQYMQTVREVLAQGRPQTGERYTPNIALYGGDSDIGLDPPASDAYAGPAAIGVASLQVSLLFSHYTVFWSILNDGVVIEPTPASQFGGFDVYPDIVDPTLPEDDGGYSPGERDAFTNNIRAQLNREAPFGFREQGGEAAWLPIIREAFRRWERVAGLRLVEVTDGGQGWDRSGWNVGVPSARNPSQGDIRIAMTAIDGTSRPDGTGGGIMAYTYPPLLNLLPVDRIDDNDTDDPDDDVLNVGYLGNIVLDEAELWNDPAVPNLFEIVMVREIGFALGMLPSCPNNPTEPFSVLQNQVFTTLVPGSPAEGQPFPQLFFREPQFDDIRAAHDLFGDRLDSNDSPAQPTFITYAPNPRDNIFRFAPHLAQPSSFFALPALQPDGVARPLQLSIDAGDSDVFRVVLPDTVTIADFRVRVEPYPPVDVEPPFTDGEFDPNDGALGDCTPTTFNRTPISYQDLSFAISAFDPFSNTFTPLIAINDTIAGEAEEVTIPVSAGTLYLTVQGDPTGGPDLPQTQLYNLTIEITTPQEETGLPFTRLQATANVDAAKDLGYFGAEARIGVIDGAHASDAHIVFSGRTIPRISWPGIGEAVTTAGAHATSTAALAAGGAFLDFEGVAPEAELVSATVATELFPDGTFAVGKNALYYALFALTSPTLAQAEGLDGPATVLLSTWGAGGRLLTGEDSVAQAYDAAAWMNQVPIVVAAGNNGLADRGFTGCALGVPVDAESPGQQYLGSRSVISPATAVNVISVGSTGEVDPEDPNIPLVLQDAEDLDQAVPGFSSRGPIDAADLDVGGTVSTNVRSGIDIVAPGTGVVALSPDFTPPDGTAVLNPCNYVGSTASSFVFVPTIESGDDPEAPTNPEAFELSQGTSVSAAIVAGSIALLQDLAADQTPALSTNPNVMKAVLLNGARKMRGWTNSGVGPGKPQDNRDGFNLNTNPLTINVASTTNPLDFAQGAGVLDLERTIQNYLTGYPEVAPGEAIFEGPTIDPEATDVRVPTIRRPPAPGTGTISVVDAWLDEPGAGPAPDAAFEVDPNFAPGDAGSDLTATDGAAIEHDVTARDPDVLFGEPLQTRPFVDQKQGRGPQGVTLPFTPRVPFTPPSTNPPGGGPGTPGGPPVGPGGGTSGVAPREIDAIVVDPIGWDLGNIDQRVIVTTVGSAGTPDGYIDYVINVPLLAARPDPANPGFELPADRITVTLCWQREIVLRELNFSNPSSPRIGIVDIAEFENLNLQLFVADANGNATGAPVRQSVSTFSATEHIFTNVPLSSLYLIRVRWAGPQSVYDLNNRRPLAEVPFAVAWRVDFSPRPASLAATDLGDVVSVLSSFGSRVGNSAYSMDVDRNYDGKVNFTDVTSVLSNWNPAARVR